MKRHLKFVIDSVLAALFGVTFLFYFAPSALNEKKVVTHSLDNNAFHVAQISEPGKEEISMWEKCHQIVTSKKRFLV